MDNCGYKEEKEETWIIVDIRKKMDNCRYKEGKKGNG